MSDEVLAKSKIQKWCECKHDKITKNLLIFFENNKDRLSSMNVYPIISNILSVDNKIMKLKDRQFDKAEDVEFCFDVFKNIMSTINLHVIYVPSQQSFCMFMGWTDRVYKKMLNNSIEDIQDMMQLINEYIIECQISAGQQGILKQNLTKFRTQLAGEHGHNLVTQKEQNEEDRSKKKIKGIDELYKQLENMGSKGLTIENGNNLSKKR
jgi:hypothetical protein